LLHCFSQLIESLLGATLGFGQLLDALFGATLRLSQLLHCFSQLIQSLLGATLRLSQLLDYTRQVLDCLRQGKQVFRKQKPSQLGPPFRILC